MVLACLLFFVVVVVVVDVVVNQLLVGVMVRVGLAWPPFSVVVVNTHGWR